jgi:hypothetical protein
MKNSFENQEAVPERSVVVEALREKGAEDPEALEMYVKWITAREEWATQENTSRANLDVNIERAELLAEAGLRQEAIEAYGDALIQAWNERLDDFDEVHEKIGLALKELGVVE